MKLIIILLTIYAPIELTRMIVWQYHYTYPELAGQFVFEVFFIWVFYLLGMYLVKRGVK
ncbi:hypothetical protein LCGC14_1487560 [marine sediment metagenome]|uniref:Uncharacterized protein n=1 Tax=marine sediment metagenome TaxID=412755 RepID=A0A0F9LNH5_9ZZZZ